MSREKLDVVAYAALLAMVLSTGSTFLFIVLALEGFSAMATASWRLIIGALFLVGVAFAIGEGLPRNGRIWAWAALFGFINYLVPAVTLSWAQQFLPTNVAGAYYASIPLMLLVMSAVFFGVKITWRKGLGLVIGSAGLVLLAGPGTGSQLGGQVPVLPQMAIFLSCICLALTGILARIIPKVAPMQLSAAAALVAAVPFVPVAAMTLPDTPPPGSAIAGLIAAGVISSGVAHFARFFLIRRKGPVFVTPNAYLAAIWTAFLGVSVLGETLTPPTLIALGIVLSGVVVAQDGSGKMKAV